MKLNPRKIDVVATIVYLHGIWGKNKKVNHILNYTIVRGIRSTSYQKYFPVISEACVDGSLSRVTSSHILTTRRPQWSSWELGSCTKLASSLRPAATRSLCPGSCSHPGTLSDALGDWEALPRGLPTPEHHLWGLQDQESVSNNPQSSRKPWDWKSVPSNSKSSGNPWWSLLGLGACTQWTTHTWKPSPKPTETGNLHQATCNHLETLGEAHRHWLSVPNDPEPAATLSEAAA